MYVDFDRQDRREDDGGYGIEIRKFRYSRNFRDRLVLVYAFKTSLKAAIRALLGRGKIGLGGE